MRSRADPGGALERTELDRAFGPEGGASEHVLRSSSGACSIPRHVARLEPRRAPTSDAGPTATGGFRGEALRGEGARAFAPAARGTCVPGAQCEGGAFVTRPDSDYVSGFFGWCERCPFPTLGEVNAVLTAYGWRPSSGESFRCAECRALLRHANGKNYPRLEHLAFPEEGKRFPPFCNYCDCSNLEEDDRTRRAKYLAELIPEGAVLALLGDCTPLPAVLPGPNPGLMQGRSPRPLLRLLQARLLGSLGRRPRRPPARMRSGLSRNLGVDP